MTLPTKLWILKTILHNKKNLIVDGIVIIVATTKLKSKSNYKMNETIHYCKISWRKDSRNLLSLKLKGFLKML